MSPIEIRLATAADAGALERLAQLDTATVPDGPVLLAETAGLAVAALELRTGRAVADPFRPTAHLVRALAAAAPAFTPPRTPARARTRLRPSLRPATG